MTPRAKLSPNHHTGKAIYNFTALCHSTLRNYETAASRRKSAFKSHEQTDKLYLVWSECTCTGVQGKSWFPSMVPTSNELLHCVVVTVPLSLQVAPRLSAPACSKSWTVGGHLALVDGRWRSHELTAGVFLASMRFCIINYTPIVRTILEGTRLLWPHRLLL
jgi:hypothetical protein